LPAGQFTVSATVPVSAGRFTLNGVVTIA
jgi:hypothetical protein